MTDKTSPSVPVQLQDDGLLWAVNASLLHPLGFALAIDPDTQELSLQGDGTERWGFGCDKQTTEFLDGRFRAFHALLDRARAHNTNSQSVVEDQNE